jgi:ribosomal protein L37AE/L43A
MTEQPRLFTRDYSSRAWTTSEIEYMRKNSHLGAKALAGIFGRSQRSVVCAATRLRISLRPPGERRGLILGQPRAQSWAEQKSIGMTADRLERIRDDVLSGDVTMTSLEARAREIALGDRARPVCPACGARPQERKSTGLCEPCHLRALAQAHRDSESQRDAQRELWRARQESSRSKRNKSAQLDIEDE